MGSPAVLILDDDLGFCMWLGGILNQAGIRALPACRSEEALAIAADSDYRIDLLIVNPHVERCAEVLEQNRNAKVMAIGGAGNLTPQGMLRRPRGRSLPPPERYLDAVRDVLNSGRVC